MRAGREGNGDMSEAVLRVVVVSKMPAAVRNLLRHKLTGYLPVTVSSVEEVAQQLRPGAVILLDLDDVPAGVAAAHKLRADGFRQGIVVIGPSAVGGLTGVIGLEPPFRLDDLANALQQAGSHEGLDSPVRPSRPQDPPASGPEQGAGPIGATTDDAEPPAPPHQPSPAQEGSTPLRRGPTEAIPKVAQHAVASADPSLLTGRQPAHPAAVESSGPAANAPVRSTLSRWRRRLGAPTIVDPASLSQREMHERLVMMLAASSQLEAIAEEVPVVTSRTALSEAIVDAVAVEFEADTVGFWHRDSGGWVVTSCYGFTHREALAPADLDQPVLQEIDANGGAILLEPLARFQPLVRGIGGAHTESFMAAAVAVGGQHFGVLAVGRDRSLVESDLDRLIEMASEAAVGIGVAEHLERMHALVEQSKARSVGDPTDLDLPGEQPADAGAPTQRATSREAGGVDTDAGPAGGAVIRPSSSAASGDEPRPDVDGGPPDPPVSVIDLSDKASDRR